MPKLNDPSVDTQKINGTSFTYSATGIEHLGATEYTLATVAVDTSGSVASFKTELENSIKVIIQALKNNPRADNLLVRITSFDTSVEEVHGFKLLENCFPDDYTDCLDVGGGTALYDATYDAIQSTNDWGQKLYDQEIDVNGIMFIVTDGCDWGSEAKIKKVKDALMDTKYQEKLESFQTFLVGVGTKNNQHVQDKLNDFQQEVGLTSYIDVADADEKSLTKLGNWASQSIAIQSQSLGTGTGSTPVSIEI